MTQHLLHIHIGPMQTFIASARRTRDLWFGSWLMSELSKAAAQGIAKQDEKNKLIFPAQGSDLTPDSDLGVSNKIAALTASPKLAANVAKDAMDKRYADLITTASLQQKLPDSWPLAKNQLYSFIEFYWVSYPINGDYANARRYADALLAARKNSRNFKRVDWEGAGLQKSSLNGRMETVIPPKLSAEAMYNQFRARSGEQLSGVDLLKRLGKAKQNDKSRFPSTSHMAAMPLEAKLAAKASDPTVLKAWKTYLGALPKAVQEQERIYLSEDLRLSVLGEMDGGLLFESRLLDFMDKGETAVPKQKLNAFLQTVGIVNPNPYYALLVGDGDGMGAAINDLKTADAHRDFSTKLAKFSQDAKTIVEREDGAVVYAGGDDVLALLPLHTAVSTTATLAQAFQNQMDGLTFSAGIAIVHHLEPLEDALELARKAEKEAKAYIKCIQKENGKPEVSKKNALAIVLNKRSGAPRIVAGRWGEIKVRLDKFVKYYRKKELPHGLAYQLRDMFLHLGGQTAVKDSSDEEQQKIVKTLRSVIVKEAGRIITHKEGSDAAAEVVIAAVAALDHKKSTIETLSNELIIAAQIASVQEETA